MVAGHETTRHTFFHHIIRKDLTEPYSVAATWALYSLAIRPDVQTKLREEIFTLSSENPSMDELESLQYLDYVVREVLRLHAPVASTFRFATKDNILPLDTPFVDTKGKTHECIRCVPLFLIDNPSHSHSIHLESEKGTLYLFL